MLNLEQSHDGQFRAELAPETKQQWEWRKNYRVGEANRKMAVYPENFLEPEWRDNQSPEFKQLEEELLQEKVSLESAEGACRIPKEEVYRPEKTLQLKNRSEIALQS